MDLTAVVDNFRAQIAVLQDELAAEEREYEQRVGVKRAQVAQLKRAMKAAERAADPNLTPLRRAGRRRSSPD